MNRQPKVTKAQREQNLKRAIDFLNDVVKIKLAPSSIEGIGVFAMRDLKKGEKLYTDMIPNALDIPYSKFKLLRPEIRELILGHWPNIINGSHFLYPVTKMNAFMNHSDDPNYDGKTDLLIKDVKAGEEITENYKVIKNWDKIYKWLK